MKKRQNIQLLLHYLVGVHHRTALVEAAAHAQSKENWRVDQKSRAKTYRVEGLAGMGTL